MKISHLVVASIAVACAAASLTEGCSGSDDSRHPCYQRAQCLNQPYPTNAEGQACGFLYNDPVCGNAYATLVDCKLNKAVCTSDGHVDQAKTNAACQTESNAYNTCKATDGGGDGGCVPRTCVQFGYTCGNPPDNCGGLLNCGTCVPPQTCGAQTPYRCGTACVPTASCNPADGGPPLCGSVPNGCGGTLNCGTGNCIAPQTCGGGGIPNQCGCLPSGTIGPNLPLSGSSLAITGGDAGSGLPWSSATLITQADNNSAQVSLTTGGQVSQYLIALGYQFSVPTNATIDGIQVDVVRSSQSGVAVSDYILQLIKGSAPIGTNHANGLTWGTGNSSNGYGGSGDLWGATWTPADINNNGQFGVALAVKQTGLGSDIAKVDAIRVTIFYSGATCN
jgi:hypothetical protein